MVRLLAIAQTVFQNRLTVFWAMVAAGCIMMAGSAAAKSAVVVADRLNLRQKPNANAPVIAILKRDTRLTVHGRQDGWLLVSSQTQRGFVRYLPQYIRVTKGSGETAAAPTPETIGRLKEKSEVLNQKISSTESMVTALLDKEASVFSALKTIETSIDQARLNIKNLKIEIAAIDQEAAQSTAAARALQKKIAQNERYAARRLVALYKLQWIGPTNLLATAESIFDLFQRKAALEKILKHDQDTLDALKNDKARMVVLTQALKQQKSEKMHLTASQQAEITQLKEERQKRSQLLSTVLSQKALHLAAVSEMKQAARELDATIADLVSQSLREPQVPEQSQEQPVAPHESPAPAPPQAEQPAGPTPPHKETAKTVPEPVSPPAVPKAAGPKPAPKSKPKLKPFVAFKGLLQLPVKGKIVTNFGKFTNEELNVVNFRSGIDIESDRGEPIHAVYGGKVIYSAWFKGYGNMIIIDHGQNYYTVYAHAEDLFKTKGSPVTAGEVIATVGDSGSLKGPGLYFELRHHGKPIDPLKWIKRS